MAWARENDGEKKKSEWVAAGGVAPPRRLERERGTALVLLWSARVGAPASRSLSSFPHAHAPCSRAYPAMLRLALLRAARAAEGRGALRGGEEAQKKGAPMGAAAARARFLFVRCPGRGGEMARPRVVHERTRAFSGPALHLERD